MVLILLNHIKTFPKNAYHGFIYSQQHYDISKDVYHGFVPFQPCYDIPHEETEDCQRPFAADIPA